MREWSSGGIPGLLWVLFSRGWIEPGGNIFQVLGTWMAASLGTWLAASRWVRGWRLLLRVRGSSPPRPLPVPTAAAVAMMPPAAAALWLAEEAAVNPRDWGLAGSWRVPRETLQLLRLCRLLPATADLPSWLAAVRGVPVACGGLVVANNQNNQPRPHGQ